jgi:erythromycin esterase
MKEFIEWSRNFNSDKKVNKIKFIGFDSQCGYCPMREILSFINNQQPELKTKLSNEGLKLLSEMNASKDYYLKKLKKDEKDLMEHTLEKMNELFEKEVALDKDIHMDLLSLNNAWEYGNSNLLNFTNVRDRNMSIIIKEIVKDETKPVLIWAHNGHINKSKSLWYKPIGYHLYENFKSEYLVIGLDFKEKTLSNDFSPLKKSNWIANKITFNASKNIDVIETKDIGKLTIRNYGISSGTMKLKNDNQFDYLVYFQEIKN